MRNGITFTGNADQAYLGQKYMLNNVNVQIVDRSDMVLQWSNDRQSTAGPDRLRFIFTTAPDGSPSGSQSREGLEAMRILPFTDDEAHVGIGDFFAGNLLDPTNVIEPTERLDVLNGRVRFRDLPDAASEADATYRVMVVDDTALPSTERGVVKWVDPSVFTTDCEWTMNAGAPNHVYTAFGATDPNCPDNAEAVVVGRDMSSGTPPGKFDVFTDRYEIGIHSDVITESTEVRAVDARATGGTEFNYGVFAAVDGTTVRSRGVYGTSSGATYYGIGGLFVSEDEAEYTTGAQGHTKSGGSGGYGVLGTCVSNAKYNAGVRGHVYSPSAEGNKRYYGVEGLSSVVPNAGQVGCGVRGEAPLATDSWAIYSLGDQFSSTGTAWTFSDAELKTEIQPIENALGQVMEFLPKSFRYRHDEFPQLNLSRGQQFGFLAPDLEVSQPEMVRTMHVPATLDSVGSELHAALDLKAVKLDGVLPLAIGAIQEQQALIAEQQQSLEALRAEVAEMREELSACCAHGDVSGSRGGATTEVLTTDPATDRKLRIVPNPFSEPPTVFYTLDRGGRMQLFANSADGKELRVLHEATLQAGEYQYAWDTSALAPGMYYVSLLLDGETLVKKAVKVDR